MKCLLIGGNRFVGLRLSLLLEHLSDVELHILNRTGQAPHCKKAVVHKGDRSGIATTGLDRDWDLVFDFACFSQADAETALGFFSKVANYIFISSASIYDWGRGLKEDAFRADTFDLRTPLQNSYQDGKRRSEAVFAQKAGFPTLSVRFPFILGEDDYSERLQFHCERVRDGKPLYVPNLDAQISLIDSIEAARFLLWAGQTLQSGALNVASPETPTLREFLAQIEAASDRAPVLVPNANPEIHSPYGVPKDHSMNVDRVRKLGFTPKSLMAWLPDLIKASVGRKQAAVLH